MRLICFGTVCRRHAPTGNGVPNRPVGLVVPGGRSDRGRLLTCDDRATVKCRRVGERRRRSQIQTTRGAECLRRRNVSTTPRAMGRHVVLNGGKRRDYDTPGC